MTVRGAGALRRDGTSQAQRALRSRIISRQVRRFRFQIELQGQGPDAVLGAQELQRAEQVAARADQVTGIAAGAGDEVLSANLIERAVQLRGCAACAGRQVRDLPDPAERLIDPGMTQQQAQHIAVVR